MTKEEATTLPEGALVRLHKFPNPYLGKVRPEDQEILYAVVKRSGGGIVWVEDENNTMWQLDAAWHFANLQVVGKDEAV